MVFLMLFSPLLNSCIPNNHFENSLGKPVCSTWGIIGYSVNSIGELAANAFLILLLKHARTWSFEPHTILVQQHTLQVSYIRVHLHQAHAILHPSRILSFYRHYGDHRFQSYNNTVYIASSIKQFGEELSHIEKLHMSMQEDS